MAVLAIADYLQYKPLTLITSFISPPPSYPIFLCVTYKLLGWENPQASLVGHERAHNFAIRHEVSWRLYVFRNLNRFNFSSGITLQVLIGLQLDYFRLFSNQMFASKASLDLMLRPGGATMSCRKIELRISRQFQLL